MNVSAQIGYFIGSSAVYGIIGYALYLGAKRLYRFIDNRRWHD